MSKSQLRDVGIGGFLKLAEDKGVPISYKSARVHAKILKILDEHDEFFYQ